MNYFFLIFFTFFSFNEKGVADNLIITFVDMDKIISDSEAGKKIQKSFNKTIEKENAKFKKMEDDLKEKQEQILKQKNIKM